LFDGAAFLFEILIKLQSTSCYVGKIEFSKGSLRMRHITLSLLLLASSLSQAYIPKGIDGSFNPDSNITLGLDGKYRYDFTNVFIGSNITIKLSSKSSLPATFEIYSQSSFDLFGTISAPQGSSLLLFAESSFALNGHIDADRLTIDAGHSISGNYFENLQTCTGSSGGILLQSSQDSTNIFDRQCKPLLDINIRIPIRPTPIVITPVSEPESLALFIIGLLGLTRKNFAR
jgi:hypothetical protein